MASEPAGAAPLIGVLALQGAFAAHATVFTGLGARTVEVRQPADLEGVAALVLPGGESTTMSMMLDRTGLRAPLASLIGAGIPTLGTCAGAILLASELHDGREDQVPLAALDISVRRNGYGRQVDSFEALIEVPAFSSAGLGDAPFHVVCIRAPLIERVGAGVEVLGWIDGRPALVRSGAIMAATFHPELAGDTRLHRLFLEGVEAATHSDPIHSEA